MDFVWILQVLNLDWNVFRYFFKIVSFLSTLSKKILSLGLTKIQKCIKLLNDILFYIWHWPLHGFKFVLIKIFIKKSMNQAKFNFDCWILLEFLTCLPQLDWKWCNWIGACSGEIENVMTFIWVIRLNWFISLLNLDKLIKSNVKVRSWVISSWRNCA